MTVQRQVRELSKRIAGLETQFRIISGEHECLHDWGYMHVHGKWIIFHCQRCGGIQRREWQDLTEQEIQGLELLGIHRPERSDK